jgi:hypothetical protein
MYNSVDSQVIWNRLSGSFGEADLSTATRVFNYIWKPELRPGDDKGRRGKADSEKDLEACLARKRF